MVVGLEDLANRGNALAREVTLPLVRGIGAFANGAYDEAVERIEPVFAQLARMGGSHAQREVFEDTLLEAYLRAEHFDRAEKLLRTRLNRRASVRDMYWLGRTQANTGQAEAAVASFSDAAEGWQDADHENDEMVTMSRVAADAGKPSHDTN